MDINDLKQIQSPIHHRVYAFALDIFIISIFKISLLFAAGTFTTLLMTLIPSTFLDSSQLQLALNMFNYSLIPLVFISYFTFTLYFFNGSTAGKSLMKLKVIDHNTNQQTLSLKTSFRRSLGYFLNFLSFGSLFVINFIRKDQLGYADFYSKSATVSLIRFNEKINQLKEQQEDNIIKFPNNKNNVNDFLEITKNSA